MNLIKQKIEFKEPFSLAPDALTLRSAIIGASQEVAQVTCASEQAQAAEIGAHLQAHIKEVKQTRLALAKPLNDACDRLIDIERDYLAPLLAEKERIGRLVTAYQVAEAHRVAEENRRRQEEIEKLEKLRLEAEVKAQRARTENGQLKAEMAAHYAEQAQQEVIRAPLPAAVKARGAATRKKLCYRVTDIEALYKAAPHLCTVSEKPSAIIATCDPSRPVPGLELWFEDKTIFRS